MKEAIANQIQARCLKQRSVGFKAKLKRILKSTIFSICKGENGKKLEKTKEKHWENCVGILDLYTKILVKQFTSSFFQHYPEIGKKTRLNDFSPLARANTIIQKKITFITLELQSIMLFTKSNS